MAKRNRITIDLEAQFPEKKEDYFWPLTPEKCRERARTTREDLRIIGMYPNWENSDEPHDMPPELYRVEIVKSLATLIPHLGRADLACLDIIAGRLAGGELFPEESVPANAEQFKTAFVC